MVEDLDGVVVDVHGGEKREVCSARIDSGAAVGDIVVDAVAGIEVVVAEVAVHPVVAGVAAEVVVPEVAVEVIVAVAAVENVITAVSEQLIDVVAAAEEVVAKIAGEEEVPPALAE